MKMVKRLNKKIIRINFTLILLTIAFAAILLFSGYTINVIKHYKSDLQSTIEERKRADARLLLKDAIDRFDHDIKTKQVDPSSLESVSQWANYNFLGLRNGSSTSDGFIIELGTERFVCDASFNGKVSSFRTVEEDIESHYNPSLAKEAYNKIKLGLSSIQGDNVTCNDDGSPEWLEWVVYPTTVSIGVNDEPKSVDGTKNSKYRKYIFVMRTQESETFAPYEIIFYTMKYMIFTIYILLFILLIFIICILFYMVYHEYIKENKWCKIEGKGNNNSV